MEKLKTFEFSVVGDIKTKQRPRATVIGGHARVYPAKDTILYENYIKTEFQRQCPDEYLFDKPFGVMIKALYKPSQELSRFKKWLHKFLYIKKQDIDNVAKVVLDSLIKIAYADDVQCVECKVSKRFTEDDVERLEVLIYELPTETMESMQHKAKIEKLKERKKELEELDKESWLNSCQKKRLEEINNQLKIEELGCTE